MESPPNQRRFGKLAQRGCRKLETKDWFLLPLLGAFCFLLLNFPANAQGFDVQSWPLKKVIPVLEGTDLNGQVWRLSDLRGKAVLLNFWASWCEPCRAEMPALEALALRHGPEKLRVLAVNFKESEATVQRFVQRAELNLPVLQDPQGVIARQWGVSVFPSTVMLGADGRVLGVVRGEFDWSGPQAATWMAALLGPASRQR